MPLASGPALHPTCPTCHQDVLSTYYFCPNCGTELHQAPLSLTPATQAGIYAFSIILPLIAFIPIMHWPGIKYYRSPDPKARRIGQVAWILLILSTVFTCWYIYNWTQHAVESAMNSINMDLNF